MEKRFSWKADSWSTSQDIPKFLWKPKFITISTRAHPFTLSWARWIQPMSSYLFL